MEKLSLLVLFVGIATPAFPAKSVKLDQLDQLLMHARGKSDRRVAKQLFNLEVTQRVSSTTYARWEAELPGPKSRQALVALADASAFLPLPPDELPAIPALDRAVQDSLLSRTRNYVANTIPKLPNFFATRDAIDFSDETEDVESMTLVDYQQRSNRGCCGLNTIRASSLPPRGWHHRGDRRETGAPISEHPACGRTLNF